MLLKLLESGHVLALEVTMICYSSLNTKSFFFYFMQLDILRWVLLRYIIKTIYHPCVIFRMSADHNYLLIFLSFPTFTVMACLIDVQVVVLLTCFQKLAARVET